MNKDNILFGVIGLLAGLIIGFMFANSVNQSAGKSATPNMQAGGMMSNSNMPPNHPDIGGQGGQNTAPPLNQAAIDKAKAEPENFEAQLSAAETNYINRKYDDAIGFLKQANKLKPDDYETIVNLGNSYFDSEKYEDAEKWYQNALTKKAEDTNVRTDLGLTFIFRQPPNYDRAIQEFSKVLESNQNHPQALQNLTVAYTKKGDATKAKDTLAKLETADPSNQAISRLREEIQKLSAK